MFKKYFLATILILLAGTSCFCDDSSAVDPSSLGVGARPLALGKAFVGYSNDASDIFMNPAGLAEINNPKAISMTGQVITDVDYSMVAGATPTQYGTFGFGYVNAGVSSIPLSTVTGSGSSAEVVPAGSTDYYSSVMTLSYSNKVSNMPFLSSYTNMDYGVNFKFFSQGFNGGGSGVSGVGGTGFDMDLGLQYFASRSLTIGLNAINILPETMGGQFTWSGGVTENIPAVIELGGTAKIMGKDSYYGGKSDLLVSMQMEAQPTQQIQSVYHVGVEWWPISVMALRAGLDQSPRATDAGTGVDNNFTAGIGLKCNGFTFDYCYHQYSDLIDNTTHYFSFGYVGEDDKPAVSSTGPILPVIVASASLESFNDVPNTYWARSPIQFMATLGVMNGYTDGTFKPDETVTRAELAEMLIKLRNVDVNDVSSDPYPDVNKDFWAAKYIKAASYLNLMSNYSDGTFKPDNKVTRVEGVVALARFTDATEPATLTKDPFVDIPKRHWAAMQIASAQDYGLLDYLIGQRFDPNKELTRAEVAEMLSKTSYGKNRIRSYLQMGAI